MDVSEPGEVPMEVVGVLTKMVLVLVDLRTATLLLGQAPWWVSRYVLR